MLEKHLVIRRQLIITWKASRHRKQHISLLRERQIIIIMIKASYYVKSISLLRDKHLIRNRLVIVRKNISSLLLEERLVCVIFIIVIRKCIEKSISLLLLLLLWNHFIVIKKCFMITRKVSCWYEENILLREKYLVIMWKTSRYYKQSVSFKKHPGIRNRLIVMRWTSYYYYSIKHLIIELLERVLLQKHLVITRKTFYCSEKNVSSFQEKFLVVIYIYICKKKKKHIAVYTKHLLYFKDFFFLNFLFIYCLLALTVAHFHMKIT